jgi:acyl-CoA synthetase
VTVSAAMSAQLPGEVFSSPVFVDSWVLLGCRDDHLYCLKVVES